VRARALRAPVFLGHMPRQTGRCAPPAASHSYLKNKNNLPNSCRPREGHLSTLPQRPESIQSARPSIQSSELGPPPPHLQESVAPPFGSKGGDTFTFRGAGGGNQFRRWGIHSGILHPPLDPRGGDTFTFRGGGGGNQFRRWGIHSGILQ
jgi:hypothetical protein